MVEWNVILNNPAERVKPMDDLYSRMLGNKHEASRFERINPSDNFAIKNLEL